MCDDRWFFWRHGRVLAAILCQVAVGSGSGTLFEVRLFFGNGVAVESLHHLRFSLKIHSETEWTMTTYSLIHHTNQPVQWILSIKTHGFPHSLERSVNWVDLGHAAGGQGFYRNDFWVPIKSCGEEMYIYIYILYIRPCNENYDHIWSLLFYYELLHFVFFLLAFLYMPFSFGIIILIHLITIWFLVMAPNLGCSLQFGTRVFALVTNCSLTFSPVFF